MPVTRFFTLQEAESVRPEVERLLTVILQSKREFESSEQNLNAIRERITLLGGMIAPRENVIQLRTRKDASARALKSSFERMEEIGCQVKDLETGLVDFPTLYKNEEVYICWKLGEPAIEYWHHVADGFAGRRPIDGEFRLNHRGDE